MQTTNLTIKTDNLRGEIAPLYCRYQGQTNAQPAYVEMDEDGNVSADYSGEIGNAVPMTVWHGRTLRWAVSNQVRGDELADLIERDDVVALLERVYLGHSVEWDGNNHVGRLDDDAQAASDELDELFAAESSDEHNLVDVYDVDDYVGNTGLLNIWRGKPLDDVVRENEEWAEEEGVIIDGDLERTLLSSAESFVARGKSGLDMHHLDALVAAKRISIDDAVEYAGDHGIAGEITAEHVVRKYSMPLGIGSVIHRWELRDKDVGRVEEAIMLANGLLNSRTLGPTDGQEVSYYADVSDEVRSLLDALMDDA